MADVNDVVRHVILRISVDQGGLAEALGRARAALKGLKEDEAKGNRERAQSNDKVTQAVEAQRKKAAETSAQALKNQEAERAGELRTEALRKELAAKETERRRAEKQHLEAVGKLNAENIRKLAAEADKAAEAAKEAAAKVEQATEKARKAKADGRTERSEVRLAGQNLRELSQVQLQADIALAQAKAADEADRKEANRQADDRRKNRTRNDAKKRADTAAVKAEERKDAAQVEIEARRDKESLARTQVTDERKRGYKDKNDDAKKLLDDTQPGRLAAAIVKTASDANISQSRADAAGSIAAAAQSRAGTAESAKQTALSRERNQLDKENVDISDRRIKQQRTVNALANDLKKYAREQETYETKLADAAERRAIALEKAAASSRRQRAGVFAGGSRLIGNLAQSAATLAFQGNDDTRFGLAREELTRIKTETGSTRQAVKGFFSQFKSGEKEAHSALSFITSRFKNFYKELKPSTSAGGGGNLIKDIFGNIGAIGDGFNNAISGMGRHLLSFRTLIVAGIAALGPLAAIIGAVGAAALGLASNLVSLAGGLAALPGIIGGVVAGFGALAIVLKPIASVFSAYSAAQKAATADATAATKAQYDLQRAIISVDRAELARSRAVQDLPRAQDKLNKSRKQAARDIEDYRLALQKLRYDEEGAQLGVESAEQEYRRALADPTKSSLDRRIARHGVEGAKFDQRDQQVAGGRLREDASEAIGKGVEGSDQVIDAIRGVQDATLDVKDAELAYKEAILARQKAQKESAAGGSAGATFQAEIDKLPEKTKKVILAIFALKDQFNKLRDELSNSIFGPISKDTDKFAGLLDSLGDFLKPAAVAMGVLAGKALSLFTNADWKKFFAGQGKENKSVISDLGDALLAFADGMRVVIELAAPFTGFITGGLKSLGERFQGFTQSDEGIAKIEKFFKIVKKRYEEFGPILGNFLKGFAFFFSALNTEGGDGKEDFTTRFNKGLLSISEKFLKLGEIANNPNSGFRKWLNDVLPLLGQIGTLIGQVGTFFGDLFSDKDNLREAQDLLKAIGEKWLPKLASIFDELSQSGIISKLADAMGSVFSVIESFLSHGGTEALSFFGSVLKGIAGTIDFLIERVPLLASAIGILGGVLAVALGAALIFNLTKLLGRITGITGAFKLLNKTFGSPFGGGGGSSDNSARGRGGRNKPSDTVGVPQLGDDDRNYSPALSRIEGLLRQINTSLRLAGGAAGGGGSGGSGTGGRGNRPPRPSGGGGGRPIVPVVPGSVTGFGPVGASTVVDGIDPNSEEGRRQRREAVRQARNNRTSVGSTPLGRLDDEIDSTINPRPTRGQRFGRGLRNFGRGIAGAFGSIGGSLLPIPPTPVYGPSEGPQPSGSRRPTYPVAGTTDQFSPYDFNTPAAKQNVARPPQPRNARGQLQPRPAPQQYDFDPYTDDDMGYTAPSRRGKQNTVPGLNDSYTVPREPQGRDARGRIQPRPAPQQYDFDPYDMGDSPRERIERSVRPKRTPGFSRPQSRFGRGISAIGRGLKRLYQDDSGSIQLAPERRTRSTDVEDDAPDSRRSRSIAVDDGDDAPESSRRSRFGRRGPAAFPEQFDVGIDDDVDDRGRQLSRAERREASRAARSERREASRAARAGRRGLGRAAGSAGRGLGRLAGGLGRNLGRLGGGLARGLGGGLAGLAVSGALSLGGDALINKYVKDDDDASSLSRGIGAVGTGASIGATIGSIVPGVGTAIGGAIGGLAGGAYSLFKDKNLRSFVGDKLQGGAKAVGGFVSGAASKAGDFFGGLFGGDKDDKGGGFSLKGALGGLAGGLAGGGLVGGLLGKTDIGKSILDSLKKAGGGIANFFTKEIPNQFHRGVKAITDFFTKTLPALPGKAFDAIATGIGVIIGFFRYKIPEAAEAAWAGITNFFTNTLPEAASAAWAGITGFFTETLPAAAQAAWDGITNFFTETLPAAASAVWSTITTFFTETLPNAAQAAWDGITNFFTVTLPGVFETIVRNISDFFGTTLPNFFTVTLPDALRQLPGFLYDNLIQPVLDFFSGVAGHVGDFLKGSFDWAKSLFQRGAKNVEAGEDSQKRMSGGLIDGVYQGIQDTAKVYATPGEFMVRKAMVDQPGAKAFLRDFNEGRVDVSSFYSGLAASAAPQVMSMVPPTAAGMTGAVPTVVNNTVHQAPIMGDVTIHNPVRERSEHSLRRQVQIAAIRHRR